MKVIYGIDKIGRFNKPVVALGVFDGVHRGHAYILKNAVNIARRINGQAVVLTFNPHPQKEGSLTSLAHRLRLFKELGVDACIVIGFNPAFARITAADFAEKILAKKIRPAYVCVGSDFKFGRGAKGDVRFLDKISGAYNFKLKAFEVMKQSGLRISSSRIRKLIVDGKLESAQRLLGRQVSLFGEVVKGASLGRKLGFPTANINPHHEIFPAPGVYAVRVALGKSIFNGACSIGTRPTFSDTKKKIIEVFIFNFHRNIYGKYMEILFVKKIREQKKFNSAHLLIEEINKDISKVKKTLFSSR